MANKPDRTSFLLRQESQTPCSGDSAALAMLSLLWLPRG